jgi:hypothetical protein
MSDGDLVKKLGTSICQWIRIMHFFEVFGLGDMAASATNT